MIWKSVIIQHINQHVGQREEVVPARRLSKSKSVRARKYDVSIEIFNLLTFWVVVPFRVDVTLAHSKVNKSCLAIRFNNNVTVLKIIECSSRVMDGG